MAEGMSYTCGMSKNILTLAALIALSANGLPSNAQIVAAGNAAEFKMTAPIATQWAGAIGAYFRSPGADASLLTPVLPLIGQVQPHDPILEPVTAEVRRAAQQLMIQVESMDPEQPEAKVLLQKVDMLNSGLFEHLATYQKRWVETALVRQKSIARAQARAEAMAGVLAPLPQTEPVLAAVEPEPAVNEATPRKGSALISFLEADARRTSYDDYDVHAFKTLTDPEEILEFVRAYADLSGGSVTRILKAFEYGTIPRATRNYWVAAIGGKYAIQNLTDPAVIAEFARTYTDYGANSQYVNDINEAVERFQVEPGTREIWLAALKAASETERPVRKGQALLEALGRQTRDAGHSSVPFYAISHLSHPEEIKEYARLYYASADPVQVWKDITGAIDGKRIAPGTERFWQAAARLGGKINQRRIFRDKAARKQSRP